MAADLKKNAIRYVSKLFIRFAGWYFCLIYVNLVKDLVANGDSKNGNANGTLSVFNGHVKNAGYISHPAYWFHFMASMAALNHVIYEMFMLFMSKSFKNVLQQSPQMCMRYVSGNRIILEIVTHVCEILECWRIEINDEPCYMSPLLASMVLLIGFCGIFRILYGPFVDSNTDKMLIHACELIGVVNAISFYYIYEEWKRRECAMESFGFDEDRTTGCCPPKIGLASIWRRINRKPSENCYPCQSSSKVHIERKCQDESEIPEILATELQMAMREPLDLYIGTYDDKPCFFLKNTNRSDTPVAILPFRRDYSEMIHLSRERSLNASITNPRNSQALTANFEPPPPYHHTELKDAGVQVS